MNSSPLGELNSPGRQALSWAVLRIHLVRRVSLVPLWKLGHSMVQWSEARVAKEEGERMGNPRLGRAV